MTGTAYLFEDFAASEAAKSASPAPSEDDVADAKLESFEAGYSSGWEDALNAHRDGQLAVSTALRDCLAEARLSKEAAFDAFVRSAETLLEGIVTQVLPPVAQDVLGHHIRDILSASLLGSLQKDILILVSPEDHDTLLRLSEDWLPDGADLIADPGLASGQADLRLGAAETRVDLAEVIAEVRKAVEAFFHVAKETSSNVG